MVVFEFTVRHNGLCFSKADDGAAIVRRVLMELTVGHCQPAVFADDTASILSGPVGIELAVRYRNNSIDQTGQAATVSCGIPIESAVFNCQFALSAIDAASSLGGSVR